MERSLSHKVLIIAGETSGDLHGAHLVKELLGLNPQLRFYGVGGDRMKDAGVSLIAHCREMAVVGITEVLGKLRTILGVYRRLKDSLSPDPPLLVILIDYPDFNLFFARAVKKQHIPIVYYISPQVWAWRKQRVRQIGRLVRKMIVIFPFEKAFYQKAGVDVEFVGHPLLNAVRPRLSRVEAFREFGLTPGVPTIGLLPGSRMSEVSRNLPPLLQALPRIARELRSVQFIIPVAPGLDFTRINDMVTFCGTPARLVSNSMYDVMHIADLLLVASGTATVEAAIMGTPMIVVYRVSSLSYFLGKLLIKVKNIGMVNIIAQRTIVPELIQHDLNAQKVTETVLRLLDDPSALHTMRKELFEVRQKLGSPGASRRAAQIIISLLREIRGNGQL